MCRPVEAVTAAASRACMHGLFKLLISHFALLSRAPPFRILLFAGLRDSTTPANERPSKALSTLRTRSWLIHMDIYGTTPTPLLYGQTCVFSHTSSCAVLQSGRQKQLRWAEWLGNRYFTPSFEDMKHMLTARGVTESFANCGRLLDALNATLDPRVPNEIRQQALQHLDTYKHTPDAPNTGFLLANDPENSSELRYFGLQLLEHAVRYRWNEWNIERTCRV